MKKLIIKNGGVLVLIGLSLIPLGCSRITAQSVKNATKTVGKEITKELIQEKIQESFKNLQNNPPQTQEIQTQVGADPNGRVYYQSNYSRIFASRSPSLGASSLKLDNLPVLKSNTLELRPKTAKSSCGDAPTGSETAWYPVFINNGDIAKINRELCADAIETTRKDTGIPTVQVASFSEQYRAIAFANKVGGDVDQGWSTG